MAKKTEERKKKRPRPTGSEGSVKSNQEDEKAPQVVPPNALQDKVSSKESLLTKKVCKDEQNASKTQETAEHKRMKVPPMHSYAGSQNKPSSSPGVEDLRLYVESLGGMLEDGWQIDSHRRHAGNKLTKIFTSPTNEKFRSRVEVAKHLGLYPNSSKKGEPHSSNDIATSDIDNDQEEQVQRKEHGSHIPRSQEGVVVHLSNGSTLATNVFKGIGNGQKILGDSIVTERCQDALRTIISTENFAALSNILNRGSTSGSIESPLQLKALPGAIDLQLIHLRLSNGVYGLTPELFSADIQQVWKNISAVGNELVSLAQSLLEFSDKQYKQQIMSLFEVSASKDVSDGKVQLQNDSQHGKQPSEGNMISLTDSHFPQANPPEKATVLLTNKSTPSHEKKLPTQTYQSKQRAKKVASSKKALVLTMKVADNNISGACKSCGLEQGMDSILCRLCKAAFHIHCTDFPLSKLQEGEWRCLSCVMDENKSKENQAAGDEATKQLRQATGKMEVCEACKKEDTNLLLCDGCRSAFHKNCIIPAIECVLDEWSYCPKCAENQRSSRKNIHENFSAPDVGNGLLCIQIPKFSPLHNDLKHDTEHEVSEYPSGGRPHESVNHATPKAAIELPSPVTIVDDVERRFLLENGNSCKACGVEGTKPIISCSFCTNRFHLSCLQPPLKRAPRNTWYCPSCLCRVCKVDADDDKILLCDACDEGYHLYCLNPPLVEKPNGAWFCPSCAKPEEVTNSTSPKQIEVSKRKRKSTEPRRSM